MGGAQPGSVDRAYTRIQRAGILANGLGAFDTFVFLMFLLPATFKGADLSRTIPINIVAFVIYMPLTFWLGGRWSEPRMDELRAWVDVRDPSAKERDRALGVAREQAFLSIRFWVAAGIVFGALNVYTGLAFGGSLLGPVVIAITSFLGGITTAGVNYLLVERAMRPITTIALSATPPARPIGPGVSGRVITVWVLSTASPVAGIVALAIAGLCGDVDKTVLGAGVLFLAMVAIGAGLLATKLTAKALGESLAAMRSALARIEEGDYEVEVPVDDSSEVGLLQTGFNRMAAGLAERERLQDLFGRHVGRDVADAALDGGIRLGGEAREVGVLFVDIVGSTGMAGRLPPERVVALLNDFFGLVVRVVESHSGFVNKFHGDGALCVFGAPVKGRDPAGCALAAARELRDRLTDELADLDAAIGVSAGEAVAGNVGAEERFEYTVIGDPVNEAARLSELAKRRPERLVASGAAVDRAATEEADRWQLGEEAVLRGRDEPTRLAVPASQARATPA